MAVCRYFACPLSPIIRTQRTEKKREVVCSLFVRFLDVDVAIVALLS